LPKANLAEVETLTRQELARQVAPSARRLGGQFDRRAVPYARFDAVMAGLRRIALQVGLEYVLLPVRDAAERPPGRAAPSPPPVGVKQSGSAAFA
jgi:hypothetical protein